MYTVGKLSLVAATAAIVSLATASAHANKLAESESAPTESKAAGSTKAKKTAPKTAKQVRAEKLKAVIDPDLGFGLGPVPKAAGPEIEVKTRSKSKSRPKTKNTSKREAKRAAKQQARARRARMQHAMSLSLGGRDSLDRAHTEEMMVLDEQNLSDSQVRAAIRANRDSIEVCVERVTTRGKAPSGHANISFTVEPLGHLTGIRVTAEGPHRKRLARCMKSAIKRWKFPASDAATDVEFPFVLDVAGTSY